MPPNLHGGERWWAGVRRGSERRHRRAPRGLATFEPNGHGTCCSFTLQLRWLEMHHYHPPLPPPPLPPPPPPPPHHHHPPHPAGLARLACWLGSAMLNGPRRRRGQDQTSVSMLEHHQILIKNESRPQVLTPRWSDRQPEPPGVRIPLLDCPSSPLVCGVRCRRPHPRTAPRRPQGS